jgi:hypothetical protein
MSEIGDFSPIDIPVPVRKLAIAEASMIPENPTMVVVGLLLMLAARFVKQRTAPFGGKAIRPVTDTERLLLFSFGLLAFVLGLARIVHK